MATGTIVSSNMLLILESLPWLFLLLAGIYSVNKSFLYDLPGETIFKQGSDQIIETEKHDTIDVDIKLGPRKGHLQLIYGGKSDKSSQPGDDSRIAS